MVVDFICCTGYTLYGDYMDDRHFNEYRYLGLNIAYYRKERGLSQSELAERINISRTHMSRVETADCAVSLDVIFDIAKILEVPVWRLFHFRVD